MSNTVYVLDRYINKYFKLDNVPDEILAEKKAWTKFVYEYEEKGRKKMSTGTYTGHTVETDMLAKFVRPLEFKEKEFFDEKQIEVRKHFPLFKKEFREKFKWAIPVTSRYQIFSRQMYFYFHSEERYQFWDFVQKFQQKVDSAVFFFQIGARDMIKLSHATDDIVWCNGKNLCCKSTRPLPSVDIEAVLIQQLEWRDIERLKWRCGKLKCSVIYEVADYIAETKNFPAKGQKVECPSCDVCWVMTSFNVNTREVVIRTEEWWRFRLALDDIVWSKEDKAKIEQARKRNHGRPRRHDKRSAKTPTKGPMKKPVPNKKEIKK